MTRRRAAKQQLGRNDVGRKFTQIHNSPRQTLRPDDPLVLGRKDDQKNDQDDEDEETDLDPTLGIFARDCSSKTIRNNTVGVACVLVTQEPHWKENVFEGLGAVIGGYFESAIRVTGNLCGAKLA